MTEAIDTKFTITSWDEKPTREFDGGGKFTKADVVLTGPSEGLASAWFEAIMYYRTDGTTTYVTLMHVTGALGGRSGSFVMQGQGTFDGKTARVDFSIVPGSGTDGLARIGGTAQSVSTHDDYPFMPFTLKYVMG